MLIEVDLDDIQSRRLPGRTPQWIVPDTGGLKVTGDRVGYRETFVWSSAGSAFISTTIEELLSRLAAGSEGPVVSPYGISHVLHHGFAPIPHTVYEGVVRLASGDTAELVVDRGHVTSTVTSSYPWLSHQSHHDQVPSTSHLRALLANAVDKQLASAGGSGILMLSSGKDSVAIAVALADNGITSVPCITFKSGPDDREHEYAAELCDRLGLEHHTVEMPNDPSTVEAALLHFFEHSPLPSVDQATIPYALVTHLTALDRGGIIDGSGNDGYMGFLPSRDMNFKYRWRIRNRPLAAMVRGRIRHDSPFNYLTRSRAETSLPGRMFRNRETRTFYADAMETQEFWYQASHDARDLDSVDFLTLSRIRQTEPARSNPKVYLAARARGLEPLLPFCDEALADYYFNLPEESRFDLSTGTNKLLLRQLLRESVDYDPVAIGSNHFQFDGASFLLANQHFVRHEILACDLWLPEVEQELDLWMAALPKRPFLFHSLLALFMLSGWHNHSTFLNGGLQAG